jgi:putative ATPase
VHGAVFWLSWAINNGEELEVICRRLLVTAAEDVGICNPLVLVYVNSAVQAAERVGFPEAKIILSSAIAYMAMNKRSKASARAIWAADELFESKDIIMPDYLKDCHYQGAKELGRGEYQDGANMGVYKPFPYGLFKAENGAEMDHMKYNDEFWENRR